MLTRVVIKNFKSIGEPGVDLELKPLTFLVGPNGGGKSSVLEAIALISQSVHHQLQLKGQLVEFSSVQDIAHKGETNRWLSLRLEFDDYNGSYLIELRHDTGEAKQTVSDENGDFVRMKLEGDRRHGLHFSVETAQKTSAPNPADYMSILEGVLFNRLPPSDTNLSSANERINAADIVDKMGLALQATDRVFFLSALRGAVPFSAGTGSTPKWVGSKGEDLLTILALADSPKYEDVRRKISVWSTRYNLLKLKAGIRGSNIIAGNYVDPQLRVPLNLALSSSGARQIITLITQLFWSPPSSIILIEEPESSLHPQAQVSLIGLFADAIKDGKQILVTTHSSLLLLAISEAVQKGAIKPSDIAVYEVSKNAQGTRARNLPLTPKGYLNRWVPTFARVESKLLREWVDNLPEK